jgi:hypothetical protein
LGQADKQFLVFPDRGGRYPGRGWFHGGQSLDLCAEDCGYDALACCLGGFSFQGGLRDVIEVGLDRLSDAADLGGYSCWAGAFLARGG